MEPLRWPLKHVLERCLTERNLSLASGYSRGASSPHIRGNVAI